jgi:hypothetical protein
MGDEKQARESIRRGSVASVYTNLELLTLGLFYHFLSRVNVFVSGNLKENPGFFRRLSSGSWHHA